MVDARHVKVDTFSAEEEFTNAFPIQCRVVLQFEPEMVCIIRFATFYLKVYDHQEDRNCYIVQGGLYHKRDFSFSRYVPKNRFREFAQSFSRDDFLQSYDPNRMFPWEPYEPVTEYKKKLPIIKWR